MALQIEGIFSNTNEYSNITDPRDYWAMVSGVTPGSMICGGFKQAVSASITNYNVVTAPNAFAVGSSTSRALVAVLDNKSSRPSANSILNAGTAVLVIKDITSNETAVVSGPLFVTTIASVWTITQDASKNCNITCTSLGSGARTPYLLNINGHVNDNATDTQTSPTIFSIELLSPTGSSVFNQDIAIPLNGSLPFVQVPSATITTTGQFTALIKTKYYKPLTNGGSYFSYSILRQFNYQVIPTTLTAPASTVASASIYSWLTNDLYYLTDLQINIDTRAVTHRHGTLTIRPSDTVNFAILFNNGTVGIDPVATDIKLAVRNSANNGPYSFWSAATVATASNSGDIYYTITMTASDDDLLNSQAARLTAGSNTAQSLLGEIQWTTTRGTFSSDTFTINVPNEVVRETDV
jgi:hypothetical protein